MKTEVPQTVMSRGRIGKPKKSAVELAGDVRMPDTTRSISLRVVMTRSKTRKVPCFRVGQILRDI